MGIMCERGIHRATYAATPIQRASSKFPKIVSNFGKNECIIHNRWDSDCLFIMDILATKFIEITYQNIIPRGIDEIKFKQSKEKLESNLSAGNLQHFISTKSNIWGISMTDSDLKSQFYPLQSFSSLRISKAIDKISNCRFNLTYPVRVYDSESKRFQTHRFSNMDSDPCSFFTSRAEVVKEHGRGISERRYFIEFDTVLGILFIMNCYSMNIDWIPLDLYDKSPYTQLLYKMIILQRKQCGIEHTTNYIRNKIGLERNRDRHSVDIIRSSLHDLKNMKLIKSWDSKGKVEKWHLYKIYK